MLACCRVGTPCISGLGSVAGGLTCWMFQGYRHGRAGLTCSSATATATCSAGNCRGRGANTWTPKSRGAEVAGWAALRLKWLRSRRGHLFSLAGSAALAAAARLWVTFTLLPRGNLPWLPALCGLQAYDQLSYRRMAASRPPVNSKHSRTMSAARTAVPNGVAHQHFSYRRFGKALLACSQSLLLPLDGLERTSIIDGSGSTWTPTMLRAALWHCLAPPAVAHLDEFRDFLAPLIFSSTQAWRRRGCLASTPPPGLSCWPPSAQVPAALLPSAPEWAAQPSPGGLCRGGALSRSAELVGLATSMRVPDAEEALLRLGLGMLSSSISACMMHLTATRAGSTA